MLGGVVGACAESRGLSLASPASLCLPPPSALHGHSQHPARPRSGVFVHLPVQTLVAHVHEDEALAGYRNPRFRWQGFRCPLHVV
ncbi:MAG: hypothetical protein V9E95_11760 [Methanothrix soehngenii]